MTSGSTSPDISVIVATYNGTDQLRLCLSSLVAQADAGVEVLIADDGSSEPETARVIEAIASDASVPVRHVWQADDGFRLARSRNNAVCEARGGTLLFLDHDIVVPPGIFDVVRATMRPGWFIGGRRVMLDEATTAQLLDGSRAPTSLFAPGFALRAMWRRLPGWRYLFPLRDRRPGGAPQCYRGMAGFCVAVARTDFEAVDGFDGIYSGYGVEDVDLMARLTHHGLSAGYLPRRATTAHLWHRSAPHDPESESYRLLDRVVASKAVQATDGLSALRDSAAV